MVTPYHRLRVQLLAGNATLSYIRYSQIGLPFNVQVYALNQLGLFYGDKGVPPGLNLINPGLSLLLRCNQIGGGAVKSIFLRGLPYVIVKDSLYSPTNQWTTAFNNYTNFLTGFLAQQQFSTPWGWWGIQSKVTAPVLKYTLGAAAPTLYQVTVTTGPVPATNQPLFAGIAPGTKLLVRFTGINGKSELNGNQVVLVVDPSDVITTHQFGVVPYAFGGKAAYQVFGFHGFQFITPQRLQTRKAGRTLFLEAGRSRNRVRT